MVSEPVVELEGFSVDENGGDHNMADDVEDGEIWSPEVVESSPAKVVETTPAEPNGPIIASNNESPVEHENSEDVLGLHGNFGNLHGENNCHGETNYDNVGPDVLSAEKDIGNIRREEREDNLVDHLQQNGPTPMIGLAKRSRNLRSPPSDASMQGPPNRGFCHDPLGDPLFDLNSPSSSVDSKNPKPPGEDCHGQPVPILPDVHPDPGVSGPFARI
ncbi:hypothetical protein Hanom_Chr06g00567731 [Helianthus anomalus]